VKCANQHYIAIHRGRRHYRPEARNVRARGDAHIRFGGQHGCKSVGAFEKTLRVIAPVGVFGDKESPAVLLGGGPQKFLVVRPAGRIAPEPDVRRIDGPVGPVGAEVPRRGDDVQEDLVFNVRREPRYHHWVDQLSARVGVRDRMRRRRGRIADLGANAHRQPVPPGPYVAGEDPLGADGNHVLVVIQPLGQFIGLRRRQDVVLEDTGRTARLDGDTRNRIGGLDARRGAPAAELRFAPGRASVEPRGRLCLERLEYRRGAFGDTGGFGGDRYDPGQLLRSGSKMRAKNNLHGAAVSDQHRFLPRRGHHLRGLAYQDRHHATVSRGDCGRAGQDRRNDAARQSRGHLTTPFG